MYFQEMISRLEGYWKKVGCVILPPLDMEVGAGTLSPYTFLKVLGKSHGVLPMCNPRGDPQTEDMAKIQTVFICTTNFR